MLNNLSLWCLQAYENALGIKSVKWSPSAASQFLAVGSLDQSVRISGDVGAER